MPGSKAEKVAVVRVFGVTKQGNSVLCKIHGFMPYFYAPAVNFKQLDCEKLRVSLNKRMQEENRQYKVKEYILKVRIVEKQPILGYSGHSKQPFFEITTALPKHVPTARRILECGLRIEGFIFHPFNSVSLAHFCSLQFTINLLSFQFIFISIYFHFNLLSFQFTFISIYFHLIVF